MVKELILIDKEFMKFIRKEFIELVKKEKIITIENEPERMNSYERNYLMQYWNDELLLKNVKYYIEQSFRCFKKTPYNDMDSTYNEVLKHKLIHMLVERLESRIYQENLLFNHIKNNKES